MEIKLDNTTESQHGAKLPVSGSIPSEYELVSETADAYCPNCDAYIVNERVTFDECCDKCGEEIEWHE